jgi:prohibitin 2
MSRYDDSPSIGIFVIPVLIPAAFFAILSSFEIVSPGHRGVVTRLGTVHQEPMPEGLNIKAPWDSVEEWSVQVQKLEVDADAGSKDLQTVHTKISLNYHLDAASTPEIRRNLGRGYEMSIIAPAIQESVKAVIAHHAAADLLASRAKVRDDMQATLQTKLDAILPNAFYISALNIENFRFEDSFNAAIAAKQVAEQEAYRARNEVEREKAEADKKIEQARGRAESRRLEAQASADATRIEAEARAEAIQVEAAALRDNPAILRLRAVERWDGVMPRVVGNDSGGMFFNLNLDSDSAPVTSSSNPEKQ